MKILCVGYALEKASGVTTFVERTAAELRSLGHAVDIVDVAKDGDRTNCVANYDVVHLHGLWQLRRYAKAAYDANVPVVWSTHGMTAPWALRHKWLKKKIAWWLFQKRDLKKAAAIHCTTEQEAEWNKRLGLRNCFVAPLGCELSHVNRIDGRWDDGRVERVDRVDRVLLFVGRMHPVKGLENLIRAWGLVGSCESLVVSGQRWKLRIVGPDEDGYLARLKSEVRSLGLDHSVEFAGPKYEEDLNREYENCDCLVLPSFTENFGATIVDAMAHCKPVIASTFTPWREVAEEKCGWWVSNEPDKLAATIREMMNIGDVRRRGMGARGRILAEEKYSWEAVALRLSDVYSKLSDTN